MQMKFLNQKIGHIVFVIFLTVLFIMPAAAAPTMNVISGGDFEAIVSPLGEWMISTSSSGQSYGAGLIDIDGAGPLALSPAFMAMAGDTGGGNVTLSQSVSLQAGIPYSFEAAIASVTPAPNADGGTVSATLGNDSMQLGTYDFETIFPDSPEYASLTGLFVPVTSGDYLLSIQIARQFQATSASPTVYLDNVKLSYESTVSAVPAPGSLVLGGFGLFLVRWLKTNHNRKPDTN